jgi:hypothetical protein
MAPHVRLQIVEGMWNGFDFTYFYLDRIYRIIRFFSPAAGILPAEGRIFLTIL